MVVPDDVEQTSASTSTSDVYHSHALPQRKSSRCLDNGSGGGRTEPHDLSDGVAIEMVEGVATTTAESSAPPTAPAAGDDDDPSQWKVIVHDLDFSEARKYATNVIHTSKYSILSFLPKNIFEQFLRVANFYFLVLLVLQLIPQITSLSPITTALPLFIVLSVTAIKDGFYDFLRHKSDRLINNRIATVITPNSSREQVPWKSVRVGSILRLENNDFVAADILVLSTSEPNGLCYVETAELDGETNLKAREAVEAVCTSTESDLRSFNGCISCERPNNVLDKFDGALLWNGDVISLDNSNIVLRGCKLRNTKWVYGVVIFAGHQTKLMQNSGKEHFKRTNLDRLMNRLLLSIFCFLVALSIFCACASSIWESSVGKDFLDYIPYDDDGNIDDPHSTAALQFFSYLITLNALVPISLYVSVELIRLGQSLLINWDLAMYHEKTDTPAKARTTTLNEELGQIEYIFSDKTGTLTQNVMRFFACTIRGTVYGGAPKPQKRSPGKAQARSSEAGRQRVTTAAWPAADGDGSPMRSGNGGDSEEATRRHGAVELAARRLEVTVTSLDPEPDGATAAGTAPTTAAEARVDSLLPGQAENEDGIIAQARSSPSRSPLTTLDERSPSPAASLLRVPPQGAHPANTSPRPKPGHRRASRTYIDRKALFTVPSMLTVNNAEEDNEEVGAERLDFPQLVQYGEAKFEFYDRALLEAVQNKDSDEFEFFHALALCHTVLAEQGTESLVYQAQSPDEAALVAAARNFGVAFVDRTPSTITLDIHGKEYTYQVLCILDFDNVRKRMSVLVRRPDGRLFLYSKGADSVIFGRSRCDFSLMSTISQQLEVFASDGLRTLCIAKRELSESEYQAWRVKHHQASTSLIDRDSKLDEVYEEIEKDLLLIGASAVEDKLQDGVPQTIANLARGNIKIWVLTGDKQETAVNIGYACRLLTLDTEVYITEGETVGEVQTSLRRIRGLIKRTRTRFAQVNGLELADVDKPSEDSGLLQQGPKFALVINGHSLTHALATSMEKLFLEAASMCVAVICCRVTPLQKALVVELVKKHKRAITLAIGDGANDVGMIKAAHIGVGISGKEGMQAVLASDYSLAQFRFLERLLLVHGRWSYMRMCKFLSYFFYKNFAFVLVQFWYAFFCGFTAQTVYDPWFISVYNLIFTSLPVVVVGITDQDVSEELCLRYPRLYIPGQQNRLFNKFVFFGSLVHGIFVSLVVYFVTFLAFWDTTDHHGMGADATFVFGSAAAGLLVIVVNSQISFDTYHWTVLNFIAVVFSMFSWFLFLLVLYAPNGFYQEWPAFFYDISVHLHLLNTSVFWFSLLLGVSFCVLPVLGYRFYVAVTRPMLVDLLRNGREPKEEEQPAEEGVTTSWRDQVAGENGRPPSPSPMSALYLPGHHQRVSSVGSTTTTATGYAFSYTPGFGELITSGRAFLGNLVTSIATLPASIATLPAPLLSRSRSNPASDVPSRSATLLAEAASSTALSFGAPGSTAAAKAGPAPSPLATSEGDDSGNR